MIAPDHAQSKISDLRSRISNHGLTTAFLLTLLLWGAHFIWLSRDTRPPVWDMALHQTYALNYVEGNNAESIQPWQRSGNYPPFVHLVIAALFWLFHPGPHIAALANLPASLILLWAVYELGKDLAGPAAGKWAAVLLVLTPYLIWISRETILDYWLAAWYAAALVALRRTQKFQSHPWSLALGAVMAAGLLTKWFFAGIMVLPLAYAFASGRTWKYPARLVHFFDSAIVAALLAAPWYIPNIPGLVRYFGQNARFGAREGEPPVLTFQSFIYYLRLLEGYQLFGLIFMLLLIAAFFCWRSRLIRDWKFLVLSIFGVWIFVSLLRTKDPRFTLPLLAPLAVVPGAWIGSWKRTRLNSALKLGLLALLCLQAYAANFGIRWLPQRFVILKGYQGSLRWDWNLYLQDYFGIFGKPAGENWRQDEILRKIAAHSAERSVKPSLALIPDLPRFNEGNFTLYARMRKTAIPVHHLQSAAGGFESFAGYNYVLMTERDQGMSWTTLNSLALNQIVVDNPDVFRLIELYLLPGGDCARLYYIARNK